MRQRSRVSHAARFSLIILAVFGSAAYAGDDMSPNWKVTGSGTTTPVGGVDVDDFTGTSTLVGSFTGEGFHVLNLNDFSVEGQATWTAPDGATLNVTYLGYAVFTGDPEFPFGFEGNMFANGGTGRLANTEGEGRMTAAFTGVPGDIVFEVEGTLHPNGK